MHGGEQTRLLSRAFSSCWGILTGLAFRSSDQALQVTTHDYFDLAASSPADKTSLWKKVCKNVSISEI